MGEAKIRPMTERDLTQVAAMARALSAHHGDVAQLSEATLARDALGADPWVCVLVAEAVDGLAGYAALTRFCRLHMGERGMELYHLFVAQTWRGRGIGQALVAAAIEAARDAGCAVLRVGTHPDNVLAESFYVSCGFERQPLVGARFRISL